MKHMVVPPGKRLVFRPFIRTRNGKLIYASAYGLRAFPILVDE
jgi:hypothetical protein